MVVRARVNGMTSASGPQIIRDARSSPDAPFDLSIDDFTLDTSDRYISFGSWIRFGDFKAVDPDGQPVRFTIESDPSGLFRVDETQGDLYCVEPRIDEPFEIVVRASAGPDDSIVKTFVIHPADVNVPPEILFAPWQIPENVVGPIGEVGYRDVNRDSVTISLIDDCDGLFEIVGDEVCITRAFDFETETQFEYSYTIQVSDGNGGVVTQTVRAEVQNDREAILPEHFSLSTGDPAVWSEFDDEISVGVIRIFDPASDLEDGYSLRIASDPTGLFKIRSHWDDDDRVLVYTGRELETTVEIVLSVANGGYVTEKTFVIRPEDINLAPEVRDVSSLNVIGEHAAAGTVLATLATSDFNGDDFTVELDGGFGGEVELVGNQVVLVGPLDYEASPSLHFTVSATDEHGKTGSTHFDIRVADQNDAPTGLFLEGGTVWENAPKDAWVGTLSGSDPEGGPLNYALLKDAGGRFYLDGDTLRAAEGFDFETRSEYEVVVSVSDDRGKTLKKTFTITVDDRNDAPTLDVRGKTIAATDAAGTLVATLSATDQDGDEVNFRLTANPGGLFKIVGDEIVLAKRMTEAVEASVEVTVKASDGEGGVTEKTITVEIDKSVQSGNGGNNTLIGDAGRNDYAGKGGDDVLRGLAGNDKLDGGDGDDILEGGLGGDELVGGKGTDTVSYASATAGVAANLDRQNATTGEATGDSYNSVENLVGSAFDDRLTGDGKTNRLDGAVGDDSLEGGSGDDVLKGGDGLDELTGGKGRDKLSGGVGPDSFVWNEQREAGDVVLDFVSDGDLLVFAVDGWKGMKDGGLALVQSDDPVATGSKQTFLFDTDGGKLWFDADGAGEGEAVFVATLRDVDKLKASDFDLV